MCLVNMYFEIRTLIFLKYFIVSSLYFNMSFDIVLNLAGEVQIVYCAHILRAFAIKYGMKYPIQYMKYSRVVETVVGWSHLAR